jgi:hypothetical protein
MADRQLAPHIEIQEPALQAKIQKRLACEQTPEYPERVHRHFQLDDGGRRAAGYKGKAGDCVVRAIAIATEKPYQEIYDLVNSAAVHERTGKRKRGISNARTGVYKVSIKRIMKQLGWVWTPTMQIGSGCTVHLRAEELPPGRLVVSVSKHLTAVIDGVIHDTHDCSRRGTRCVYGYWQPPDVRRVRSLAPNGPSLLKKPAPRNQVEKPRRAKSFLEWLFG